MAIDERDKGEAVNKDKDDEEMDEEDQDQNNELPFLNFDEIEQACNNVMNKNLDKKLISQNEKIKNQFEIIRN